MDDIELDDSFFSCDSTSCSFISAGSGSSVNLTLHDQISNTLSNFPNNFNAIHINAQSVPGHYSDLLASFNDLHLDALLISESFLKPSLPSSQFALPGFSLIRKDRTGKGGGGVAIYLRAGIPHKVIIGSPAPYSASAEYLFIELLLHHSKILLAVFYCPNLNIDYFDSLEGILSDLRPSYEHVVLMGDFNTCLLKSNSRSSKLLSILSSFNLHILTTSATHHFPDCTPSLLDLMIVSSPNKVDCHGQLTACFSYHDLLYLSYRVRPPKRKSQYVFRRNYNGINLEALQCDASNIDWSLITENTCIDRKVSFFTKIILKLFNCHAPLKRIKLKHNPAPWLSTDIKLLMARRDKAKRRSKRFPTEINLASYKVLRNRCSRMCRDAKRHYFHESLSNRKSSDAWRFLRSVGIGKTPTAAPGDTDLNSLNYYFSGSPVSLDGPSVNATLLELHQSSTSADYLPFILSTVSEEDVKKSLLAITSTSIGDDGICSRMITLVLPFVLPILTHIFNHSLTHCLFPTAWKKAHVIPLPKTSHPSLPSHFRPISILPYLSKVLEHVVHKQLSYFLLHNNLLSPYQSGFRPGHSTVTALLNVTDDIRWAMENKSLTLLVLLDFSSAFNSVNFDVLLGLLSTMNVSTSAISWFDSYLRGRSQCVRLDENFSDWCGLAVGVPQGGVLSPLLFSVFINSVTKVISSNFHLYADDLQLYRHFLPDEAHSAVAAINDDLNRISTWAGSFGLLVNPNKSQAIIIGSKGMQSRVNTTPVGPVVFNGVPIPYSDTVKNLGVTLDGNLSWKSHITEVSRKVFFSFHSLKCLQSFLPYKTKVALAQTLIQPLFDYADACYLDATEELLDKLERLQNLCIRFIFGLRKFDHVSGFREKLKWLPIRLRRNTRLLCLLFNVLYNPSYPSYLQERFSFSHPPGALCRSHLLLQLKTPPHKTDFFSYSFSVHAVRLWNALPPNIQDSSSISLFKKRLKEHYLSS